jgi:hypothetical protein
MTSVNSFSGVDFEAKIDDMVLLHKSGGKFGELGGDVVLPA